MKKSHRKQLYFSRLSEPPTENHICSIEIENMVKIKLWRRKRDGNWRRRN